MTIVNISTYKFVRLEKLKTWQVDIKKACLQAGVKGTVLLSEEGINIALAGEAEAVGSIKAFFQSHMAFHDLDFKDSYSESLPFKRLVIKIKPEIITFKQEGIDVEAHTVPAIAPKTLHEWYASGKDFTIVDTRNQCERDYGHFENDVDLHIDKFTDLPAALEALPEAMKHKPVVIYCTGGVRCEKAGPIFESKGFRDVRQLEGGILRYFEECQGDFYDRACFVFDDRISVTPDLGRALIANPPRTE